eukprot:gnl/MRDRNA2_/MRDRNA2_70628_c0_seq1.p1 gnl/MRDRNA2_/MRDRNA2_70628_c0~~gnl/MRDRNA2_/MRDRNA2_70628_c0_seq1.p1  ORF type:complete len:220 (+),score=40.34 gnl/MRDRNA2_/MRDRNA2_70628_c0_seq1:76-735(+)
MFVLKCSFVFLSGFLSFLHLGKGNAQKVSIGTKDQRNKCPRWQQMGCLLDTAEKACEAGEGDVGEGDVKTLVSKLERESIWMCCCPYPYMPCTKAERDAECDAMMVEHIHPHIASPGSPKQFLESLQKVRGGLRALGGADCEVMAPLEPLSYCGYESQPQQQRSLGRADLFCEMLTWQWEELGDGDAGEFERNGCPMVKADRARNGNSRKGGSLRDDEL